jgi:hypothetical protein
VTRTYPEEFIPKDDETVANELADSYRKNGKNPLSAFDEESDNFDNIKEFLGP